MSSSTAIIDKGDGSDADKDDEDKVMSDLIESFALMPQIMDKYETRFVGVQQSELCKPSGMVIPKLPIYHPYHPFRNVTSDDILQVPLAILLPNTNLVPTQLLELITKKHIDVTPYFVVQTLPYNLDTDVICRYQYALFPDAKSEMKGHESIFAQSTVLLYGQQLEKEKKIPATSIKIYESDKTKDTSPTILCGNSMLLGKVEDLKGRGIWSLVLGSHSNTLDDDGLLAETTQAYVGYTYFLPDEDSYNSFITTILREKKTREVQLECLPAIIMDWLEKLEGC